MNQCFSNLSVHIHRLQVPYPGNSGSVGLERSPGICIWTGCLGDGSGRGAQTTHKNISSTERPVSALSREKLEDVETGPGHRHLNRPPVRPGPVEQGYAPEVSCPVPHHLVFLKRQPLDHPLAIFYKLAVKRFFNRPNGS